MTSLQNVPNEWCCPFKYLYEAEICFSIRFGLQKKLMHCVLLWESLSCFYLFQVYNVLGLTLLAVCLYVARNRTSFATERRSPICFVLNAAPPCKKQCRLSEIGWLVLCVAPKSGTAEVQNHAWHEQMLMTYGLQLSFFARCCLMYKFSCSDSIRTLQLTETMPFVPIKSGFQLLLYRRHMLLTPANGEWKLLVCGGAAKPNTTSGIVVSTNSHSQLFVLDFKVFLFPLMILSSESVPVFINSRIHLDAADVIFSAALKLQHGAMFCCFVCGYSRLAALRMCGFLHR